MLTNDSFVSIAHISAQERVITGVVALLLGVFLLYGAGFAQANILHNAAHDTRHAVTVPCH